MIINARLNTADLNHAIKEIEQYALDLPVKAERFGAELAEIGITVARANTYVEVDDEYRNMGNAIEFRKEVVQEDGRVVTIITAIGEEYLKTWLNGSAMVNPLLMAEFGSGWRAIEGHQGTFPNQHVAFMRPWHWTDDSGQYHESYGSEPSRPLFKAEQEMVRQILEVAFRVFKT